MAEALSCCGAVLLSLRLETLIMLKEWKKKDEKKRFLFSIVVQAEKFLVFTELHIWPSYILSWPVWELLTPRWLLSKLWLIPNRLSAKLASGSFQAFQCSAGLKLDLCTPAGHLFLSVMEAGLGLHIWIGGGTTLVYSCLCTCIFLFSPTVFAAINMHMCTGPPRSDVSCSQNSLIRCVSSWSDWWIRDP